MLHHLMDGIAGMVKNVVFRQIKAGKAGTFCRASNKCVPSVESLFQQNNDLLEELNGIHYLPFISNTLQVHKLTRRDVVRMVQQNLIFFIVKRIRFTTQKNQVSTHLFSSIYELAVC